MDGSTIAVLETCAGIAFAIFLYCILKYVGMNKKQSSGHLADYDEQEDKKEPPDTFEFVQGICNERGYVKTSKKLGQYIAMRKDVVGDDDKYDDWTDEWETDSIRYVKAAKRVTAGVLCKILNAAYYDPVCNEHYEENDDDEDLDDCGNCPISLFEEKGCRLKNGSLAGIIETLKKEAEIVDKKKSVIEVICPYCETEIGTKSRFCPNCGASLEGNGKSKQIDS